MQNKRSPPHSCTTVPAVFPKAVKAQCELSVNYFEKCMRKNFGIRKMDLISYMYICDSKAALILMLLPIT